MAHEATQHGSERVRVDVSQGCDSFEGEGDAQHGCVLDERGFLVGEAIEASADDGAHRKVAPQKMPAYPLTDPAIHRCEPQDTEADRTGEQQDHPITR